jgi:hypothetical protein
LAAAFIPAKTLGTSTFKGEDSWLLSNLEKLGVKQDKIS